VITYNIAMNTKLEGKRTLLLTPNIKVSYNLTHFWHCFRANCPGSSTDPSSIYSAMRLFLGYPNKDKETPYDYIRRKKHWKRSFQVGGCYSEDKRNREAC
jgi:hypothetical protein